MNELIKKGGGNIFVLLGLTAGGILFVAFTFSVVWVVNFLDYIFWFLAVPGFLAFISFMTSVRFYSPLAITETEVYTMFNGRAEVIHDEEWDASLGVAFVNGYNAAKRLLSKADIERIGPGVPGKATLLVTASPFMIESIANGRFFAIRGTPLEMNRWEARAFLSRPSVRRVLGDEVRSAKVHWIASSKSLHTDEMPKDVSTLGDLADTLQNWRGEIAGSVDMFSEEFLRKLKSIKSFRESPLERMAKEHAWKPSKEEEPRE